MLKLMEFDVEDAVAWRITGKVTEDDMQLAMDVLRDAIASHGKVSVYQEIESLGGVELDAIMEKLRFLAEFGVSSFNKVAVVTDKQWLQRIITWEDKVFRDIDMRAFGTEDRDRAFNFLAYGDDPGSSSVVA